MYINVAQYCEYAYDTYTSKSVARKYKHVAKRCMCVCTCKYEYVYIHLNIYIYVYMYICIHT